MPMEEFCNACCFKGCNLRSTLNPNTSRREICLSPYLPKAPDHFPDTTADILSLLQTSLHVSLLAFSSEVYLRRLKLQIQRHWSFWRRASHFEVCSAVWVKEPKQSEAARKMCPSKYPEKGASSTWIQRHFLGEKCEGF